MPGSRSAAAAAAAAATSPESHAGPGSESDTGDNFRELQTVLRLGEPENRGGRRVAMGLGLERCRRAEPPGPRLLRGASGIGPRTGGRVRQGGCRNLPSESPGPVGPEGGSSRPGPRLWRHRLSICKTAAMMAAGGPAIGGRRQASSLGRPKAGPSLERNPSNPFQKPLEVQ